MTVVHRLKEIVAALMYATEADSLEGVLQRIADVARELTETKYAALGIPDGKGSLRYFMVSGIAQEDAAKIDHLPEGLGLIGAIMTEREVIRLDNMKTDPRSTKFPENHPPMTSFLGVPVQLGGQLFGMMYLCDKTSGQPFDDADITLVETMATYAALAIAGASIRDQQSRITVLEERERIAMELHDGIIQSLYGIGMQVELLKHEEAVEGAQLNPIIDYLNQVIEDIRGYIGNLRQHDIEQPSVHDCMQQLIDRLHIPSSLQTHIDAPDTPMPFLPATSEAICLIASEALSNAVRHSNARHIHISSVQADGKFMLQIMDDGDGFDMKAIDGHRGLGLRNMEQRARLYGGEIVIDSSPGDGTRLAINIPVRRY